MNRFSLTTFLLIFTLCPVVSEAQGPIKRAFDRGVSKLPFKKQQKEKGTEELWLNENHGPWLIMTASFFGEQGEKQALELVTEFRERYKVPAYLYRTKIDLGSAEGRDYELDENGQLRRRRMKYSNVDEEYEEVAVLVGEFASFNDDNAQKMLKNVKYAKPKSLSLGEGENTYQRMGALRQVLTMASPDEEKKKKGPMGSAFLITNPLIPDEYFEQNTQDEFVLKINKDIEYGLLKCPKEYSVKVATFRGKSTWNVKEIEEEKKSFNLKKALGKAVETELSLALEKAHRLTLALRKRGFEAYEFHDRFESTVYIGSFDKVGELRRDGKIEIDPRINQIITQFKATEETLPGLKGVMKPKSLPELPKVVFDLQPIPVEVPKYRVSQTTNRFRR